MARATTRSSGFLPRACLALLVASRSALGQKQCYYPNGEPSEIHFPCDIDADVSVCCTGTDGSNNRNCLENRLCLDRSGRVSRGACTEKDWLSPECNPICLDLQDDGQFLDNCEYKTGRSIDFCCSLKGDTDCCDTANKRFKILPENPGTWARWEDGNFTVVGDVIDISSQETNTNTETIATSDLEAEVSTTAEAATTTDDSNAATTTSGGPAETDSSGGGDSDSSSDELSTGAKAGIGVGAGVGALLIAAVIWLGYRNYQHRKTTPQSPGAPGGMGMYNGGYQQPPMQQHTEYHSPMAQDGYAHSQMGAGGEYYQPTMSPKYQQPAATPVEMSAYPQDNRPRSELA